MKKNKINIYLCHAVRDFEEFRIAEIANFLESQKEIHQVFFVEEDLKGNIDAFMEETIPKCQILLFFASYYAIESRDCMFELRFAIKNKVEIIPIRGRDFIWSDLAHTGLDRMRGFEWDPEQFNSFSKSLSEYILQYILHLSKEEHKVDKLKIQIKETLDHLLDIYDFEQYISENVENFILLFEQNSPEKSLYRLFTDFNNLYYKEKAHYLVFLSYSTEDSCLYDIKDIADKLTCFEEIQDVYYWEGDVTNSIVKYMNDYISKSDVLILFCSENAIKSHWVELEWTTAIQLKKLVIPVFIDESEIPPLLSSMIGIKLKKPENIKGKIEKLHQLIIKKLS